MESNTSWSERGAAFCNVLSVVGPSVCIVHCLAMPILLAVMPAFGLSKSLFGLNDQTIALIILPLCALAIVPGYFKHGQKRVLLSMFLGFSLVIFGSFFAENMIGPTGEIPVNVLGSVFLITASVMNHRLRSCFGHDH
ncbi:MAG: MerC domain-containing protein [Candidatus Obscuribacterales bacterium]|nr:MerC domain-containing protein [Candidatus Obscuribacterales bacterium]